MFDPLADIIDLRDVIAEWDDNEDARSFLFIMVSDLGYNETKVNGDFLDEIRRYAEEIADNEPTIIARRYFVEYAQELADELTLPTESRNSTIPWPLYCIDWEYAARELEHDYSSFTFDGRAYLIRSF